MTFALHHQIRNKYGIKSFFTRPYTFQGKGTLEKRRGLIRAFLPKEIDFNEINYQNIAEIEKQSTAGLLENPTT